MSSYTPVLRVKGSGASARGALVLRLFVSGRRGVVALGASVLPQHFDAPKGRVKPAEPRAADLNALIARAVAAAEAAEAALRGRGEAVTTDAVARAVRVAVGREDPVGGGGAGPEHVALVDFAAHHIAAHRRRGGERVARKQDVTLAKVQVFLESAKLGPRFPLIALTHGQVRLFAGLLRDLPPVGYGNAPATVAKELAVLREWCRAASASGYAPPGFDPVQGLRVKAPAPVRDRLSWDDIARLEGLGPENGVGRGEAYWPGRRAGARTYTGAHPALLGVARDLWLAAFFMAGMRFGDLVELRVGDIEDDEAGRPVRVRYAMHKNGKAVVVALAPQASAIIERYRDAARVRTGERVAGEARLFPLLGDRDTATPTARVQVHDSANTLVNKTLAQVALAAGIAKRVTMHTARHSFAELADEAGWQATDVQQALRHSSLATTQRYLEALRQTRVDDRLTELMARRGGAAGP